KKKEIASVSMMPPGLTASLRRDEFIHLVRFMSELGKEGSFKVPPRRLVRRWRVLNFTDAIKESVRQGDQRFYALKDDVKEWLPTYSTVRGVLPVNAIPSAKRWLNLVAPLRFEVDVTASGMMAIRNWTSHDHTGSRSQCLSKTHTGSRTRGCRRFNGCRATHERDLEGL
ncbi:MAG: hypothetical protein ACKVHP_23035, partial [Verrucomicrobiales bacterium]